MDHQARNGLLSEDYQAIAAALVCPRADSTQRSGDQAGDESAGSSPRANNCGPLADIEA